MERPRVAVVGPGAVGGYFGGMLARAGARVTLVGRPGTALGAHLSQVARHGLRIEGARIRETIAVEVTDTPRAVAGAELVLFCVKTVDTDEAASGIAPYVRDGAIVVSLQNGVDNVERLRRAGVDALAAVVFVGAAVERPGVIDHRGRGDLVVGALAGGSRAGAPTDAGRVAVWFERAGVPCRVAETIERELWIKLIINSMSNPIAAVTGATYAEIAEFEPAWRLAVVIAGEAVGVGNAAGVGLELDEVLARARAVIESVGASTASTRQDVERGRATEIDALNGYLSRRGSELGIPTPVNDAMHALVKLRERRGGAQQP
ncbi:MAG TPA: 2-dehydropantoate 2-reductase [Candidatus Polarisedimenticolaceae bacterium]|nr:2-dehydropantoate 2-reductase [Candidatus Polarisedimenticolaceae bacterium]